MPTVKIYATQSAYVDNNNPNTNYSTGDFIYCSGDESKRAFISFGNADDNKYLFQKIITSITLNTYCKANESGRTNVRSVYETLDCTSVTYNNHPSSYWLGQEGVVVTNTTKYEWDKYFYTISDNYSSYEFLRALFENGCALYGSQRATDYQTLTI